MLGTIKNILQVQIANISSKQPKFVFTHVPKCAGSALSESLLDGIYSRLIKHSSLTTGINAKLASDVSEIIGINEQKIREIYLASYLESNKKVFVTGHCYASPNLVSKFKSRWNFITVLRDPVDRFISEFVYNTYKNTDWNKNSMDINEYIATDKMLKSGVTYARFFSGMDLEEIFTNPQKAIDQSVENLKSYYKVGFLDNLDIWVSELNQEFGTNIRNKNTNSSPNKALMEDIRSDINKINRIEELCAVDKSIYFQIREFYEKKTLTK